MIVVVEEGENRKLLGREDAWFYKRKWSRWLRRKKMAGFEKQKRMILMVEEEENRRLLGREDD